MAKKSALKVGDAGNVPNLVAKHAFKFNKAQVMPDKRQYRRKAKNNRIEPFVIAPLGFITKGFKLMGISCLSSRTVLNSY